MSVELLINDMKKQGIILWVEDGKLHYRAPDQAMTDTVLNTLKENKADIITHLSQVSDTSVPQVVPAPADRYQPYPVTDIQRAYLLGRDRNFDLGNTGCHTYFELESPDLDVKRLEQAWQLLIRQHDMLRVVFPSESTQQVLETVPPYEIQVTDLSGQPEKWRQWRQEDIRKTMSHQVFNTGQWPLFEIRASVTPENVRVHFSLDLLIADFHSTHFLFRELHRLYRQNDGDREPIDEAPMDLTFRDCVLAMDEMRHSPAYKRAESYWMNRLDTLPPAPKLPLAVSPDTIIKPWFNHRHSILPKADWNRLRQLSKAAGITPSVALTAVYAEVLANWSSSPRFTLNLTLFNRPPMHERIQDVVGDFTSVNLLEIDGRPGGSFKEKALRIQAQLWEDLDHSQYSGVEVLGALARKRPDTLMPVVFSSTVGLESKVADEFDLNRLGRMNYVITQTPQVFIDYQVREEEEGLVVSWDAVDELFPPDLLDQMFEAHAGMLERLSKDEAHWDEAVPALIPDSQLKVREAANATDKPLSTETLYSLFTKQVKETPDRTAVVSGTTRLAYRELYEKSNRVAHALMQGGLDRGGRVGVIMEKGWEQVAAVLGTLAAGGAYLPIDPDLPGERVDFLIKNGGIGQVLTQHRLEGALALPASVQTVFVDQLPTAPEVSVKGPGPQDLAYIIYTSGSTGNPKGVMIDHRGAVNTILDIIERFGLTKEDRILGLSSLSFDLSVFDVFGALAMGATLVLPDHDRSREPEHWTQMVLDEGITVWNSVPALMQMMVDHHGQALDTRFPSPNLVMLSGDWIPLKLPDRIRQLFSEACQVVSLGGATEASIWSICHPIHKVSPEWKSIPYGKPMANQRFHVLDHRIHHCPDWVPGSLYIQGTGLALGYWQDKEKTGQQFIRHPHTGERLYRTGDTGRYLPDGTIEFLGREDAQVKIRGYRIELGEVESAMRRSPKVGDAVVTVGTISGKNSYLVGHWVAETDDMTTESPSKEYEADRDEAWRTLTAAGDRRADQWETAVDPAAMETIVAQMDRVGLACICRALRQLNLFSRAKERHTLEFLIKEYGIHDTYHRLFRRWLQTLVREGMLIETDEDTFECTAPLSSGEGDGSLSTLLAMFRDQDIPLDYLAYLEQSREHLVALLRRDQDPLDLFYAGGASDTADSVYRVNPVRSHHNGIMHELLRTIAHRHREAGNRLSILEVGAGIGGTTSFLLPGLADGSADMDVSYTYTDVSPYFLNKGKERFDDYPFVEYALFDLNRPPEEQGIAHDAFDVIISGDTLHGVKHIDNSLGYLHRMLSPGGHLLILEVTHDSSLMQVSMEFLEGLNQFEDPVRCRINSPFLTAELWPEALAAAGFDRTSVFPGDSAAVKGFGQHVFVAGKSSGDSEELDRQALQQLLAGILPSYMVPARLNRCERFPMTPNGKIDRKALALANCGSGGGADDEGDESHRASRTGQGGEPKNQVEQGLVEIWKELFQQTHIYTHDNFFELGGDSLILIQLAEAIQKRFGDGIKESFNINRILENPTIAELAPGLSVNIGPEGAREPVSSAKRNASVVVVKAKGHLQPFFCVHDGTLSLDALRHLPQYFDPDRPLYGFEVADPDQYHSRDPERLIPEIAAEYADAIQELQPRGPYLLGGYCMGGVTAFEMARQLEERGETVARLVFISTGLPLVWIEDDVVMPFVYSKMWPVNHDRFGLNFDTAQGLDFLDVLFSVCPDGIPSGALAGHFEKEPHRSTMTAYRYGRLSSMDLEERLALFYRAAVNSVPGFSTMTPDQFTTLFKNYRASYNAQARFCRGTFSGTIDFIRPRDAVYPLTYKNDAAAIWEPHAKGGVRVTPVTGAHPTCLQDPHIHLTARTINRVLKSSGV